MNIDWSRAPEGATHWDPLDQNYLRQFGEIAQSWSELEQSWTFKDWRLPDDLSAMPRLIKRPSWSGEGLPPVGIYIEIRNPLHREVRAESEKFIGQKVRSAAVFRMSESGIDMVAVDGGSDLGCEVFRADMAFPVRTAEQIAAEERENEIKAMLVFYRTYSGGSESPYRFCSKLYDAGYRKQKSSQ